MVTLHFYDSECYWGLFCFVGFFFKPYLGLARQGRAASWLGPVHEQLTGVGVDEAQSVFQHVRWDLLEND